jgi:hypothetical protein
VRPAPHNVGAASSMTIASRDGSSKRTTELET